MPRPKMSKEEKAERKRIQQRKYYLKKKAQRKGQPNTPKTSDLISAEKIQKNWLRIQRTVFSEDVQNYFVQLYERQLMDKVSENTSNFHASEHSDSLNNHEISVESEHKINGNS